MRNSKEILNDIETKLNEAALSILQEKKRQYAFWCRLDTIPKGSKPIEAYEAGREIVIMFDDRDIPEDHNCDEMGCGTGSHVWMRIQKEKRVEVRG